MEGSFYIQDFIRRSNRRRIHNCHKRPSISPPFSNRQTSMYSGKKRAAISCRWQIDRLPLPQAQI